MANLVLNLTKPGEQAQKLQLNLSKGERFTVRLSWDGATDIDLHAIACVNDGSGAKASSLGDILSTYNVQRRIGGQEVGTLRKKADGTFEVHGGALVHSADALDGAQEGIDEWISIDPSLLPSPGCGVIEIPLVSMIHPQSGSKRFSDVKNAAVSIVNSAGVELMRASLSTQFGEFIGVQMGSVMVEASGSAKFVAVGVGFNGDFNSVLTHFS
jgi:tellurium resistance protein TerD